MTKQRLQALLLTVHELTSLKNKIDELLAGEVISSSDWNSDALKSEQKVYHNTAYHLKKAMDEIDGAVKHLQFVISNEVDT